MRCGAGIRWCVSAGYFLVTSHSRLSSSVSCPPLLTSLSERALRVRDESGSKVRWTDRDTERYDPRVKRVNERPSVMSRE